jgi:hypothetical protein
MSDTELLPKSEPVRRLEVFTGAGRRRTGKSPFAGSSPLSPARESDLVLVFFRRRYITDRSFRNRGRLAPGIRTPFLYELPINYSSRLKSLPL